MKHYRFRDLSIVSAKKPFNAQLFWEHSTYGLILVDSGDQTKLLISTDKGDNWTDIDLTGTTAQKIQAGWLDTDDLWLVTCDNDGTADLFTVLYVQLDNSNTITDVGDSAGADANSVYVYDIFKIGTDFFVLDKELIGGLNKIVVWEVDTAPFTLEDDFQGADCAATLGPMTFVAVVGTIAYFNIDFTGCPQVTMMKYDDSITTITEFADLAAYSHPSRSQQSMAYDGSNIIFFVSNKDADGLDYLVEYSISGNSYSVKSVYDIVFQLDRNNSGNVPNELEKAFSTDSVETIYEIKPRRGGILILQNMASITDAVFIAMTDNFLMNNDGDMFEWTEVSSKVERIRINDGILPRRKTSNMTIHPDNEGTWEKGDSIKVYDDSDVLCFWGKITTKDRNNKGLYFYNMDAYANELFKITYVNTYSSDKTSEKLQDIIDNACDFCYRSSSIVGTAIDYNYVFKRSIIYMFHLARFLEREVCYVEPDGLVRTKAYNSLTATGESWNLNATTNNIVLVDIPGVQEAQRGYYVADVGVTRATVRYQNNTTTTKPVAGTRDPIEQVKGITPLKEFRDAKLEAATEADQLTTNLYDIFSSTSEYIGLKVNGEGWQQPGETIQLQNTGVVIIAQDNFLILSVIYDPKNDTYERMILSDNMVFSKELNSFLDTSGTQIHAANLQSIENQADVATNLSYQTTQHNREIFPVYVAAYDGVTSGNNNVYRTIGSMAFGKDSKTTGNHYGRYLFDLPSDYVAGQDLTCIIWWFDATGNDVKDYSVSFYYHSDAEGRNLANTADATWTGVAGAFGNNRETLTITGTNISASDHLHVEIFLEDDSNTIVTNISGISILVPVNTRD